MTSFPVVWKYEANIVLADTTSSKIGQRNEALVCHRSPKSPSPLQSKTKQKVYVLLTPLRAEMPTLCRVFLSLFLSRTLLTQLMWWLDHQRALTYKTLTRDAGLRCENPPHINSSSRGNWLKISSTKPTRPMPAVYFHLSSSTSQTCQPLAETPTSRCQGPGPQGEPGAE